ncbi:LuxR family transcriptional regulator [Sinorhizobium meliloti]|nr:LuxR family transcriptional regulator [Sinorhizobium meliloti]RVN81095.1 LuxR family transcriptional regulator [Sinorhizobium meliloti]RVO03130.1 LuxR family transcriptional regulator [Sinorhizobium meliloti]
MGMLSPLEKACLHWLSKRRTIEDIVRLEAKSVSEIETCLARAMASREVKTTDGALHWRGLVGCP